VAAFLTMGRAKRSLLLPRGEDWRIFNAMVHKRITTMNCGAQWVRSEVWATGPKVDRWSRTRFAPHLSVISTYIHGLSRKQIQKSSIK